MDSVRLDATALARTATVVRHRGNVDDGGDFQADGLETTDGGVAAEARTADANLDFLEAVGHGVAGGVLGDDLRGVGGGLAGAAEVALAGGGPRDHGTLLVRDGNDRVVERGRDVRDAGSDVLGALGLADLDRGKLFLEEVFFVSIWKQCRYGFLISQFVKLKGLNNSQIFNINIV